MVSVGVWAAAGHITLASPEAAAARLVSPAPLWVLAGAFLLAWFVPAWRRYPSTASPALMATLPWLPVQTPAILLLWTGPLAWLPIGAAVAATLNVTAVRGFDAAPSLRPARSVILAGILTLLFSAATVRSLSDLLPLGDEPHYLVITESLIRDHDLEVQNNYDDRSWAKYFGGALAPDFLQRGSHGEAFSIHAPGTPVLVLPAFALLGYAGAQWTIVIVASLAGAILWWAAWLAARDQGAAWFAWLAIAGSATFLVQSVTIFPDGPAMLAVALAVAFLASATSSDRRPNGGLLVATSIGLAALPWLHTRFVIVSVGMAAVVAWQLARDRDRPGPGRRVQLLRFFAAPCVSAAAWFAFFYVLYGTPNPLVPYGDSHDTRLAYIPGGFLGLLFDQQFGLLAYSPVLAGIACAVRARTGEGQPLWAAVGVCAAYLAAVAAYWMWYAGVPASPARFAAIVLPALAPALAVGWNRSSAPARALLSIALAVSLATTAVTVGAAEGTLVWNTRGMNATWLAWLNGVADLSRAWPSFFWGLRAGEPASELHFGLHVGVWAGVIALSIVAWSLWHRRRGGRDALLLRDAGWWLTVTLTMVVAAGWWVNGATGLDPARSQIAWLRAALTGHAGYSIRGMAVSRIETADGAVRIRAIRHDAAGRGEFVPTPLEDVPAGVYEVTVRDRRPRAGTVSFRLMRSPDPIRQFVVPDPGRAKLLLALPGGAETLAIDSPAHAQAWRTVDLTPLSLDPSVTGRAVVNAHFGPADVFFCDRAVFVERDGFWVRGGETAEIVVAVADRRRTIELELGNGAAANAVRLTAKGGVTEIPLAAGESRRTAISLGDGGSAGLRIHSPAGFRPAAAGSNGDTRYLGVHVKVVDDSTQ